jgi:dihydropteroate synthase
MNFIPSTPDSTLKKIPAPDKDNIGHFTARGRRVSWLGRPLLMGILNINDDSFSSDGRIDAAWALDRAVEMVSQGADIIDVGGESARTNRAAISPEEEIRRVRPFLKSAATVLASARPRSNDQVFPPLVSLNTWRPAVVEACLEAGFDILNDMGAMPDDTNASHCARIGAALLIMHSRGEPKVKHTGETYGDVMAELEDFFAVKIAAAQNAGVPRQSLILDPGIDFAKQAVDNLRIYRNLARLTASGFPVLLPVSRKSVIGRVLDIPAPTDRDAGTVACIVEGCLQGAAIFRVHNLEAAWMTRQTVSVLGERALTARPMREL